MLMRKFFVYIMTNRNKKVSYVGITGNLYGRVLQHKNKRIKGFTRKYNITLFVYYDELEDPYDAIMREK